MSARKRPKNGSPLLSGAKPFSLPLKSPGCVVGLPWSSSLLRANFPNGFFGSTFASSGFFSGFFSSGFTAGLFVPLLWFTDKAEAQGPQLRDMEAIEATIAYKKTPIKQPQKQSEVHTSELRPRPQ